MKSGEMIVKQDYALHVTGYAAKHLLSLLAKGERGRYRAICKLLANHFAVIAEIAQQGEVSGAKPLFTEALGRRR